MTTIEGAVEVLPWPDIFSYDHKEYRVIRLANQMKVLLVHDKSVQDGTFSPNKPACGLTIDVGSLSDPPDIPGLAQFAVERFQRYYKFEELTSSMKNWYRNWHGTNSVAYDDGSVFIFNSRMDSLDEILAQFAEMLKTPAIDERDMSYFLGQIKINAKACLDLPRRLISRTATNGHPARKHAYDDMNSVEAMDVHTLRPRISEFVDHHYSAHRMYLCLQTNLSLDEMQDMVVKHFSSVPDNKRPGIDFSPFTHENAYQPKFHENVFFIKGSNAGAEITLTWCVPPETPVSKCRPYHFLGYLLESNGENSISAYLEKNNWTESFDATIDTNVVFTLFEINVRLTDDGVQYVDDVLEVIFSYIRLNLQELKHSTSLEQLYWDSVNLRRMSTLRETDNVHRLLDEILYYTSDNFGKVEYDANAVAKAIDSLNERKFNVVFVSKNEYDESFEYCEMSGQTYAERAFPEKWAALWENPHAFAEISVPTVNPYISTDFSLVYNVMHTGPKYPEKVYETEVSELWFRPGGIRLDACGGCYFHFQSPILLNSPKNLTMLAVLERIVLSRKENRSIIAINDLFQNWCLFKKNDTGFVIKLFGPNHKQRLIMSDLTKMLTNLEFNMTSEEFQNAIRGERRHNRWKMCVSPTEFTEDLVSSIVRINYVAPHDKIHHLESIQFADFREFCQQFFAQMKIRALIQGNFTVDEAKSIVDTVETNLRCEKVDDNVGMKKIGRSLPAGVHRLSIKSFNCEKDTSTALLYYQIGLQTLRRRVLWRFLRDIILAAWFSPFDFKIYPKCITELNLDDGILGLIITAENDGEGCRDTSLNDLCEGYPEEVITAIRELSPGDFQTAHKYSLDASDYRNDYQQIEIDRNWLEILNGDYLFDRMEQEREIISTISQSEIIEFANEFFESASRILRIEYVGCKETRDIPDYELVYAENNSTGSEIRIENIDEFKAMLGEAKLHTLE